MTARDPVGAVGRWTEELAGRCRRGVPELRCPYLAGSVGIGEFNLTVSDVDLPLREAVRHRLDSIQDPGAGSPRMEIGS